MKKLSVLYGILLWVGASFLASCSSDNQGVADGNGVSVPENVLSEFNRLYPGATDVEWSEKADYVIADFYWNGARVAVGQKHKAWFALSDGELDMQEKEIRYADLPQAVRTAFEASQYAQAPWRRDDEADMLTRSNPSAEVLYVIDVEKKENGTETEVELYYTAEGILAKEMVDTEIDDDRWELLPQTPSDQISTWIDARYSGAKIVDIDYENRMTEVEFIFEGYKYEACFDAEQTWVYTQKDLRKSDYETLPAPVKTTLEASDEYRSGMAIDDIEAFDSAAYGKFYAFELENDRTDAEAELYISESGERIARPSWK